MSLVQTLTQTLRSKYAARMDKNEYRGSRYGAWDFFVDQSKKSDGIIDPETLSNIKRSFGNTVQVPVLDAQDVTISNVRACTVAPSENVSKQVTLVFATYSFGFTMYPAQHYANQISYELDYQKKLEKYLLKFAAVLDSAAISKLNTDKNIYFPADLTAYYPQVGNALQVTQAQKNDFYNNLEAIMNTMDYYEKINIISSTTGKPLVNRLDAQGAGNGINEAFQLQGYDWYFSNRIANGVGIQSTQFAVPDGYVSVVNRNDPDAVMGSRVGNIKEWGEVTLPIVDLKVASYHYKDCADISALHAGTTGLTRSLVEGFEFSTDIAFITNYNSAMATRYNPILKTEISAS